MLLIGFPFSNPAATYVTVGRYCSWISGCSAPFAMQSWLVEDPLWLVIVRLSPIRYNPVSEEPEYGS
jgi:hypothetical protein